MKKMIASALLLSSMNAFAYNSEYAKLTPGKKIYIDVMKKDVISLTLETKSSSDKAEPKFTRESQWGNFECEYKQTLLLNSGYDLAKKLYKKTWEIQVTWTPGADLSGCIVKVSFPGLEESRAELFMNY